MTIMKTRKFAAAAVLALAALSAAGDAAAQTRSGGRQGPNGRGYTYTVTRGSGSVTGQVETNKGYGATVDHQGSVNAHGVYRGSTTVTANNGATVETQGAYAHGAAAGVVTVTGPEGQSATRGGAVYVPR
jgi:hypothetical protein